MRLFNAFIYFLILLTFIEAEKIATTNDENQTEDLEYVVIRALFTKINLLISETEKVNKKLDALEHRLKTQEQNLNEFKDEITDIVQTQSLKYGNVCNGGHQNIKNGSENLIRYQTTFQPNKPQNNKLIDFTSLKQMHNWTIILRRENGSEDFYRSWSEYKEGFGNPNTEFFIGLEKLHALTTNGDPPELFIILKDFNNQTRYALYDGFVVWGEDKKYRLAKLGAYSGDAGDSLRLHANAMFSTKDQDNDEWHLNCADVFKGAWWFVKCFNSHLMGPYRTKATPRALSERGIIWKTFHGPEYSLKFVEMMIKSKS